MRKLEVYTDGSHLKRDITGRIGCGGVIIDVSEGTGMMGKELDSFSLELTPEYLEQEIDTTQVSNPTAEMIGVLEALRQFRKYLKTADEVTIYADYLGVREWLGDKWRCKEIYISKLKTKILKELNLLGLKGKVKFEWVKGHQAKSILSRDAYWNNIVDKLAKGEK